MKKRGIVSLKYDNFEDYMAIGHQEKALKDSITNMVKDNKYVFSFQFKMTEKRGDAPPDINKMKFSTA